MMKYTDKMGEGYGELSFIDKVKAAITNFDILGKNKALNLKYDGLKEPYKMASVMLLTVIFVNLWQLAWVLIPLTLVSRTVATKEVDPTEE